MEGVLNSDSFSGLDRTFTLRDTSVIQWNGFPDVTLLPVYRTPGNDSRDSFYCLRVFLLRRGYSSSRFETRVSKENRNS